MKSVYRQRGLVLLAYVAMAWSCGKPPPRLFPVSGVVVNGNKPVSRAAISFAADISQGGETLDAYASTDAEGRFNLQTVTHGKGVPAGRYKVVISTDGPSSRLIPAKFTDLSSTTMIVDIPG